jgi:Protein of unknown function (DUF3108)
MANHQHGSAKRRETPREGFGSVAGRGLITGTLFAAVLLALAIDAGSSLAYAQAKLDADYKVTLLGLPIGSISWTVNLQDNQFAAAASGATSGLMRIFSGGHGSVTASGTVAVGQPISSNFTLSVIAGKWSDDVQISYSGGKAKETLSGPQPPSSPNKVPLTDAHRVGVVDPMSALLISVPGTGDTTVPEACQRTVAVFDGHTRYDLRLAFKRLDTVKTAKGYQGPVVVCSVYFAPVAGYDPERFIVKYLAAQRDMEMSLAPIGTSRLMVPYRISVHTPMGLGVLQATRFEAFRSLATNLN